MSHSKILRSYQAQYTDPIVLETGQRVKLGKEETEEKWKGWIWAESETHAGWIPIQMVEFSENRNVGILTEPYSAKELDVNAGDEIIKIKSLNGWTWAKNLKNNEEGWIPDEIME